ncbi:hypothetical protein LSH36_3518g00002 [Paralvinella palmiformis]|uniref:Uncharacterized protein n=1 Tax=Paralvinella palmiformis TaxID=53620 RepID=A0AAD9IQK7_9ANNE|nr:hypothetical protein LSH36_3518g00002 [Paralvinella palmiformis]
MDWKTKLPFSTPGEVKMALGQGHWCQLYVSVMAAS